MKKNISNISRALALYISILFSITLIAKIPGALDPTFNPQGPIAGVVSTAVSEGRDLAQAVVVQPDNKIVAAGLAFNGLIDVIALVRYNNDGSLDSSFGDNGIVLTETSNGNSYAYSVTLDAENRILITGSAQSEKGNYDFIVARYNTNGSLDKTFGNNGIVLTDFEDRFDQANKILVQPDNKILVVGLARPAEGNPALALARFNNDGSLDTSFGQGGKVLTMLDDSTHQALGLGIQDDGKIVISGFILVKKSQSRIILLRYNNDGSLDNAFGENGVVETQFEPLSFGTSLVIQPDNKIAIAANIITSGFNYAVPGVVQYNADGTLDTSFGSNGLAVVDIGERTEIHDIERDSFGNLIIGGFVIKESKTNQPEPLTNVLLVSFTPEGKLDKESGVSILSLGQDVTGRSFSMALTPDNKIVIAGGTSEGLDGMESDFLVARFINKNNLNFGKMSSLVKAIIKKYCNKK